MTDFTSVIKKQNAKEKRELIHRKKKAHMLIDEFVKKAIAIDANIKKIILFGSFLTNRWTMQSDIDIAVESAHYYTIVSLGHSFSIHIDVVDLQNTNPAILERIQEGQVLYEKSC